MAQKKRTVTRTPRKAKRRLRSAPSGPASPLFQDLLAAKARRDGRDPTIVKLDDMKATIQAMTADLADFNKSRRHQFISLDSIEPGLVHVRAGAIDVVSHPVQRPSGDSDGRGEFQLYVTLQSGQKTVILDTPGNRKTLGLPSAPPREAYVAPPPAGRRGPRVKQKPATIANPPASPTGEPQVHDEDNDE